jgi:hypothetical protein
MRDMPSADLDLWMAVGSWATAATQHSDLLYSPPVIYRRDAFSLSNRVAGDSPWIIRRDLCAALTALCESFGIRGVVV